MKSPRHAEERGVGWDPLTREIEWARRRGHLDDAVGRSLLRVWGLGIGDPATREILLERIRDLKVREALGVLDPFREPGLHDGDLLLGTSTSGDEIRVPLQTAASGILSVMPTGGGKSNWLRFLAPQLAARGVSVWIVEQSKKECRDLLPLFPPGNRGLVVVRPEELKYDPLHPGRCDLRRHLTNLSNVLARGLGLGDRSHTVIYQTCDALYHKFGNWDGMTEAWPCLFDLYELVKSTPKILPAVRDSILDRMAPLLLEMKAWRLGWSASDLVERSICFELGAAPESLKHIVSESLLYTVFQSEVERGTVNAPLRLVAAFEDAQAYAQPDPTGRMTPLDIAAGTVRGTGIGVFLNVQTMEGLSRNLVPNLTGLKLMGSPGSNDDAWRLGSDMGLDREQIEWAKRNLAPGTYVARTNQWPEPFVLHVPRIPSPNRISDEAAEASLHSLEQLPTQEAEEYADWQPNHIIRVSSHSQTGTHSVNGSGSVPGGAARGLSKEELDYLESVATRPFLGMTQRDEHLGVGSWKGNKIRGRLLKKCLVSEVAINPGGRGRRFKLLELTENGSELLGSFGIRTSHGRGRGGVEHKWWSWRISGWLKEKGLIAKIEDESLGVRVDILVRSGVDAVAVEVETSRGHELENVRKDLSAGCSRVITLLEDRRRADGLRAALVRELPLETPRIHVGDLPDYQEVLGKALGLAAHEGR